MVATVIQIIVKDNEFDPINDIIATAIAKQYFIVFIIVVIKIMLIK